MQTDSFHIIDSIGVGATSEVFKAKNLSTDKFVALKFFSSVVTRDETCLQRLQLEIDILKQLDHQNIVRLLSHKQSEDKYYIELELVDGGDLKKWREGYLYGLNEPLLWILSQILRGLGAAHEKGIIHRDLKPENVLISKTGQVKITDFGLAKSLDRLTMTKMGLLVGSLGYMAPEIINGSKAGTSSDIFSFGAIAYELLTGQPAFHGETPQALIKKITDQDFTSIQSLAPHVPSEIASLIESCLNKDPKLRPQSVWSIEAEIMNNLLASGLLSYCQSLVSEKAQIIYKKALTVKHEGLLKKEKELFAENTPRENFKSSLIDLANEFQTLFPQDPKTAELLGRIGQISDGKRNKKYIVAILLLLFLGLASLVYVSTFRKMPPPIESTPVEASVVSSDSSIDKDSKAVKPVLERPKTKKTKKVVAPKPAYGSIQFKVDPGVEVFVDNIKVPENRISNYRVQAGRHRIKLKKSGFVPIESDIMVKAGKPAVIQAQGAIQ